MSVSQKDLCTAGIFIKRAKERLLPYGLTREEFTFHTGIENEYKIHMSTFN